MFYIYKGTHLFLRHKIEKLDQKPETDFHNFFFKAYKKHIQKFQKSHLTFLKKQKQKNPT